MSAAHYHIRRTLRAMARSLRNLFGRSPRSRRGQSGSSTSDHDAATGVTSGETIVLGNPDALPAVPGEGTATAPPAAPASPPAQ